MMLPDPYLSDLMKLHHFSIIGMHAHASGNASARGVQSGTGWHEVVLRIRRDIVCEACGHAFDYTFDCHTGGTVHRGQRTLDAPALITALEHQLRRRIACPHCHAVQQHVRRTFIRRELRHNLIGLSALFGTVAGAAALSLGGYAVGGEWGLGAGLVASLALAFVLTRWMLLRLLDGI